MADILKDLLQAYYDDIAERMQPGQTFGYLEAHWIIRSPLLPIPELDPATPLPFLLIYPQPVRIERDVMGGKSAQKIYPITLSAFQYPDDTVGLMGDHILEGAIDIANDLYTIYDYENFDLSILGLATSISYNPILHPALVEAHQTHVTFEHLYKDRRS